MWNEAYLESRVLSADPVELVSLLYEGAIGAVEQARRHLAEGDIRERAAAISKAVGILIELSRAVNPQAGELSQRLLQLYDYLQRRLLEANFQQIDEPLGEVLRLLRTVAEGWTAVCAQAEPPQPKASSWGSTTIVEEPVGCYVPQSWSA
ncbi:MAG TPA: flagellar export chaperone FliS [Bryobacteraceae bacterium]|nr:flagellar export chaperone FliS [Bryobacteraceae bacterium]